MRLRISASGPACTRPSACLSPGRRTRPGHRGSVPPECVRGATASSAILCLAGMAKRDRAGRFSKGLAATIAVLVVAVEKLQKLLPGIAGDLYRNLRSHLN